MPRPNIPVYRDPLAIVAIVYTAIHYHGIYKLILTLLP